MILFKCDSCLIEVISYTEKIPIGWAYVQLHCEGPPQIGCSMECRQILGDRQRKRKRQSPAIPFAELDRIHFVGPPSIVDRCYSNAACGIPYTEVMMSTTQPELISCPKCRTALQLQGGQR